MASGDILRMFKQILTIDSRVDTLLLTLERLEAKIDGYTERLARLEVRFEDFRESLRSQIIGEVMAETLSTAAKVDANYHRLSEEIRADVLKSLGQRALLSKRDHSSEPETE